MLAISKKSASEGIGRLGEEVRKAGGLLTAVAAAAVAALLLGAAALLIALRRCVAVPA